MITARIAIASLLASAAAPALADEGMWTFDAFPTAAVQKAYGWAPDKAWLDRVRQSAVRLTGGCSASVVSSQGLVLTNHHCVVECAQNLSTPTQDLVKSGFLAATKPEEKACPGQQAEIVTSISDVTPRVQQAIGSNSGAALASARDAAISAIAKEGCPDTKTMRCQVVTLFGGGQYKLYKYRKYSDVRLVYAPEFQAAFFGGDPDNFNFPRYAADAAFLRLYEGGKPVVTPVHLKWNPRAPQPGEITFVVGNPGSTQRLYTEAQRAMARDVQLPGLELYLAELRGRLISAMAGDAEKTRTGADALFGIENSYKARYGQWQALLDPAFANKLAVAEQELRAHVATDDALGHRIGDPWREIADAMQSYRNLYLPYTFLEARAGASSALYDYAKELVRAALERAKPEAQRLPAYSDAALPLLEHELLDERPVYPWLEELNLSFWLSKARENLTADDPAVKALLGKESPEGLAHRLVSGSKLADPAVRKALWQGGIAAVRASQDPLIQFVLANEPAARAVLDRYRAEVDAPVTAAQSRLAQARFAAYGESLYPDATFTLRISYGQVKGWTYRGRTIEPVTRIGGMFERATGAPPFDLPPAWAKAEPRLDKNLVFDFTTTNDIIGGNSGSPVIARDGSVIGAAFDGNIHSLGGNFGYDPELNRTVVVSTGAVQEALKKVYPAPALLAELASK